VSGPGFDSTAFDAPSGRGRSFDERGRSRPTTTSPFDPARSIGDASGTSGSGRAESPSRGVSDPVSGPASGGSGFGSGRVSGAETTPGFGSFPGFSGPPAGSPGGSGTPSQPSTPGGSGQGGGGSPSETPPQRPRSPIPDDDRDDDDEDEVFGSPFGGREDVFTDFVNPLTGGVLETE
jgi:hypothetical protein